MKRTPLKRRSGLKRKRPTKKKRRKRSAKEILKDKAWTALSRAIRLEAADDQGFCICITCGAKRRWNRGIQGGHFIDGRTNGILFDERGIHCQCEKCNRWNSGNKVEYTLFMLEKHGLQVINELKQQRKAPKSFTVEELEGMIERYQARVRVQEDRLGI